MYQLIYTGASRHGVSFQLANSRKVVTLDFRNKVHTINEQLTPNQLKYYKSLRPVGVVIVKMPTNKEEETPVVVEETPAEVVTEEVVEEEVAPAVEEEVKEDINLVEVLGAMSEEEVNKVFEKVGFSSRKRSLSAKIAECVGAHESQLLELLNSGKDDK